jgi:hypothetical protein
MCILSPPDSSTPIISRLSPYFVLHDGTVRGLAKVAGLSDDWPPAAAQQGERGGGGGGGGGGGPAPPPTTRSPLGVGRGVMGDFCQAVWACPGALNGVSSSDYSPRIHAGASGMTQACSPKPTMFSAALRSRSR